MSRSFAPFVLLVVLVLGCLPSPGSENATSSEPSEAGDVEVGRTRESTIIEVQADVRRRMEAHYRGDLEALMPFAIRALESEVFASDATEADLRKALQEDIDRFAALDADLESVVFHEPPKFAQTSERLYVIVPFKLIERNRTTGDRTEAVEFSTGILEKNAEGFYYFDGPIPIEKLRQRFPDLPAGYKHPEQSVRILEDERFEKVESPPSTLPQDRTPETRVAEVQNDVRIELKALYAGDVDALMVFGRRMKRGPMKNVFPNEEAAWRKSFDYQIDPIRLRGGKIESIEFPEPPEFIQSSDRLYAFVPFSLVEKQMTTGLRTRLDSFSIGVLEPEADGFYYIDARHLTQGTELLRQVFPDLPNDSQFPKISLTPLPSDPSEGEFAELSPATKLPFGESRTHEAMEAALQADIRRQVEANYVQDALTQLRYLYAKDREGPRAEELLKNLDFHFKALKQLNVDVQSVEFEPATFLQGENRQFATVRYSVIAISKTDGRTRFRISEFAVGVLEPEASQFGYVRDTSKYNLHEAYPDFPKDVQIPDYELEKLPD